MQVPGLTLVLARQRELKLRAAGCGGRTARCRSVRPNAPPLSLSRISQVLPVVDLEGKDAHRRPTTVESLPYAFVQALASKATDAIDPLSVFVTLERLRLIDRRFPDGIVEPNFPLMPTLHKKFDGIQKAARAHMANQRDVDIDEIPWRSGCFHDLRDTYLTSIKTVSVDVLKRLAGHASLTTTLKYYTSPTARDADAVRAALAEAGLSKGARVQGTLRAHNADRSA